MADVFSLLVMIVLVTLLVVGTLLLVSTWRSKRYRKWFYLNLLFCEIVWVFNLERLFPLLGTPRAWLDGVEVVLFALMVPTLVLLYRHRRDPDPPDPDAL